MIADFINLIWLLGATALVCCGLVYMFSPKTATDWAKKIALAVGATTVLLMLLQDLVNQLIKVLRANLLLVGFGFILLSVLAYLIIHLRLRQDRPKADQSSASRGNSGTIDKLSETFRQDQAVAKEPTKESAV